MSEPKTTLGQNPWLRMAAQAATILVSAAILYYFLHRLDWRALRTAAERANLLGAALASALPIIIYWITDAVFTVRSMAWFHRPVSFRDYLFLKASAYLLTMINIIFGASVTFLYLMRKAEISADKQAGIFAWRLVVAATGAVLFYGVIAAGMLIFEPETAKAIPSVAWIIIFPLFLLVLFELASLAVRGKGLITPRLMLRFSAEFGSAFRMAAAGHWAKGLGYTLPPLIANYACLFWLARSFHIQAPLLTLWFWFPIVNLISALPVAFGGFGTTTAAWAAFFSAYGSEADLVAATLLMPAVRLLARAALAAVFLPWTMKEINSLMKK